MLRNLLLVSLDWTRAKDPPMSLGHASILANLQHHKIDVITQSWAVNHASFSHHHVTKFILDSANSRTDVALGAFVWNEKAVQLILDDLKREQFSGNIILGGPQVSYVKKNIEAFYPQADIFIRGYAENAMVKLMQSDVSRFESIKGVHYANQPDLELSATADLETLPSPFLTGLIPAQRFIRWETQRGCPFRCSFCQHRESDISQKRRALSLSRILQEVEWITNNPVISDIAVLDPTFNSGPQYLRVLDAFIERKYQGKLSLQSRIEMTNIEFLDKITQLNKTAHVVLEFGLQTIHPNEQAVIDRPNNMRLVEKVLRQVKDRNIDCEISLIFGLPKQTIASFQQSIDFCTLHRIPTIHAFPLMLLRGTPLYARKDELGLVESNEISLPAIDRIQTDIPHVVTSPSFTYDDWQEMAKLAESLEQYNQENRNTRIRLLHSLWKPTDNPHLPARSAEENRNFQSSYRASHN